MVNITNIAPDLGFNFEQIIFLATALSMSSIITTIKTLIHMNRFNTPVGRTILSTAIIDAMGGLFVFTLLSTFVMTIALDIPKVIGISALTLAFFLVFLLADHIIPTLLKDAIVLKVEEAQFTTAFVVMLALAWLAEAFGLNGIIGAFLAGMIISKTSFRESGFAEKLSSMSYGIFIPVFFAWIGLQFVPMWNIFIPLLIIIVLTSNFIGTWLGCTLGNMKQRDSISVSIGMLPRGGIDLVLIAAAKNLGILTGVAGDIIFTSVILLILVSVAITPPLLRAIIR
jgi:Kef-type K+ transport system membrane component KefB